MTPRSPLQALSLTLAAILPACASSGGEEPAPEPVAEATMMDAQGNEVGTIRFLPIFDGDQMRLQGSLSVDGLGAGLHGFHIHETGLCEGPDFESAGGHFNPYDAPHGPPDAPLDSRHAGDLGNLNVAGDGTVPVDRVVRVARDGDEPSIVVGRALMLHAGEDDFETQPDGDGGNRVACGVIEAVGS